MNKTIEQHVIHSKNFIKHQNFKTRTGGVWLQRFSCRSCGLIFASETTGGYAYITEDVMDDARTHIEYVHPRIFSRPTEHDCYLAGCGNVEGE